MKFSWHSLPSFEFSSVFEQNNPDAIDNMYCEDIHKTFSFSSFNPNFIFLPQSLVCLLLLQLSYFQNLSVLQIQVVF